MTSVHATIYGDDYELHDDLRHDDLNLRLLELYVEGFQTAWRMLKGVDKETSVEFTLSPHPGQPDFLNISVTAHNSDGRTHKAIGDIDHPLVPFTERAEGPDAVDVAEGCRERSDRGREGSQGHEAPRQQGPSEGDTRSFERPPGPPKRPPWHRRLS